MSVDPQTQRLFDAIAAVNYPQVKSLIDSGVGVNSQNDRGQTPLALACRQGNLEIVDLLIAAGAQMQVQQNLTPSLPSVLPIENVRQAIASDESTESPLSDRSVAYDDLLDLIHQPITSSTTELEGFIQVGGAAFLPELSTTKQQDALFPQVAAPQPDAISAPLPTPEPKLTPPPPELDRIQTVDATVDKDSMFTYSTFNLEDIGELTMTSYSLPANMSEFKADESYVFDLSQDLDRLTTEWETEEPDQLSIPMGEWEENETYVIDLDSLTQVEPEIEADKIDKIDNRSRIFEIEEDLFENAGTFEDGETYVRDLDELDGYDVLDALTPQSESSEEVRVDSELNFNQFSSMASEDRADFDPDTQTSTDIFGQSKNDSDELETTVAIDRHDTNTSLMAAIIDGDLDLAQQAIEVGASLDRYDWNLGYSPLGMAIDRGYPEIVKCLLAAGANPRCGSTSMTALGLAAERGEVEILQMLLPRGVDVNEPVSRDNWSALLSAIKNGHQSVVQLLVSAGANVNIWSCGETPILLAAKSEEREIYNYLYPLVNTSIRLCADRDGEQLLQATRKRRIREQNRAVEKSIAMAMEGNAIEVKRAIEIGVEIDEIGAQGYTALMAAAYYGHLSVVKILLAAGADPNLLSDDDGLGNGMTALMMVASSFFATNRQAIAKILIAGGADVNQQGAGGKTAIMYAALTGAGDRDCVETLIAAGANLDLRDDRGHTLVTLVAAAENYQLLNLLIQSGASTAGLESIQLIQSATAGNINRVRSLISNKVNLDLDRGAAIGNAAAAGHTKIVELLIGAGANVNLINRAGFTPIASAAYAGHAEIVRLLVTAGADTQAPAGGSHNYSALEYAQMGLYQFEREDLQHAQIIRFLEQLEQR